MALGTTSTGASVKRRTVEARYWVETVTPSTSESTHRAASRSASSWARVLSLFGALQLLVASRRG